MPEISVIIPTHNRAFALKRALRSVLQSSMQDLEVIVVDDASTDEIASLISELQDSRVRYDKLPVKSNGNVARNRGIEMSRSPVIAFLDSDDTFLAGRVERLTQYFADHAEVGCIVDGFRVISGVKASTVNLPKTILRDNSFSDLLIKHAVPLTCSSIVARRCSLERINGFDGTLVRQQDRDLLLRLSSGNAVALGTGHDVTKYRSDDSLSHNPIGYIESLDELVARHPRFREAQFEDVLLYLTSRVIIKSFLSGKFKPGLQELTSLKRSTYLPRSLTKGLIRYMHGKRIRASAMAR